MGRKVKQLSIDGIGVDLSKARFADTFDVAETDERLLAYDEEIVYVVVARVSTPSFRESVKTGDVSRVNVLKVREARLVRDEEFKSTLLEKLDFGVRPQPSLFEDETTPDPEPEIKIREIEQTPVDVEEEIVVPDEPPAEWYEEYKRRAQDEESEDEKIFAAASMLVDEDLGLDDDAPRPRPQPDTGSVLHRFPQTSDNDPVLANFLR